MWRNSFQNWDDIGYSFLIGGDGNVYEGRGFGTKGSHSYCYNQYAYGIAFIGNFCIRMPEAIATEAYETFMRVPSDAANTALTFIISFSRSQCIIALGYVDPDYVMCGHRDVETSTVCPGPRFGSNWVNSHAHYGRRDEDGRVCVHSNYTSFRCSSSISRISITLPLRNAHPGMSRGHRIALNGSIQQNQGAIARQVATARIHSLIPCATKLVALAKQLR